MSYLRRQESECEVLPEDDALISWENSRILAERIKGAEQVILEPAGHCFWLEQPEQSTDAIARFLSRH